MRVGALPELVALLVLLGVALVGRGKRGWRRRTAAGER
jgi:hypothetical protein